ncbi:MAG: hypothetical protein IID53_07345 [Proteobacteria bacterium]|nr:hypothetical protein [Pseudomonadota bacterium]
MLRNWQHLRSILTAIMLLLVASLGSFAQSQQPPLTPTESSQPTKADAGSSGQPAPESERKAEARTPALKVGPASNAPDDATKKREGHNKESMTDWWLMIFSGTIAVFTIVLAFSTIGLWISTHRMARHGVASERAYITMSHRPPGLLLHGLSGQMQVTIQVRNAGRTPATISNLVISVKVLPNGTPLPEEPDYGQEQDEPTAKAFLATGDSFDQTRPLSVSSSEMTEVKRRSKILYALGYVDYIDQFGQRHPSGYARKYHPKRGENNLIFVTQHGYNYDRPRMKGEGYDWENTGPA